MKKITFLLITFAILAVAVFFSHNHWQQDYIHDPSTDAEIVCDLYLNSSNPEKTMRVLENKIQKYKSIKSKNELEEFAYKIQARLFSLIYGRSTDIGPYFYKINKLLYNERLANKDKTDIIKGIKTSTPINDAIELKKMRSQAQSSDFLRALVEKSNIYINQYGISYFEELIRFSYSDLNDFRNKSETEWLFGEWIGKCWYQSTPTYPGQITAPLIYTSTLNIVNESTLYYDGKKTSYRIINNELVIRDPDAPNSGVYISIPIDEPNKRLYLGQYGSTNYYYYKE